MVYTHFLSEQMPNFEFLLELTIILDEQRFAKFRNLREIVGVFDRFRENELRKALEKEKQDICKCKRWQGYYIDGNDSQNYVSSNTTFFSSSPDIASNNKIKC